MTAEDTERHSKLIHMAMHRAALKQYVCMRECVCVRACVSVCDITMQKDI